MKKRKIVCSISFLLFGITILLLLSATKPSVNKNEIVLTPESGLMTETINSAVDQCSANGGGIVRFSRGTYLSGTIELKSNVILLFDKGAILQGSDKFSDYRNDAFIFGKELSNISIQGEGVIDGVDCYNPKGEEGFRGPHCIRLINCRKIQIKGITIKNSANWAINCRYCSGAVVENVSIRGGHDGLHTRFCSNFKVTRCDFRTGDDAFAGNDNQDFEITDCKINTSCNGFRMGCMNLTVRRCHLWGPGESVHKIQKRNNMLAAFVHFSPKDENPKLESGNWLIEDVTVDNVDQFYVYNFHSGLWQTGQPATTVQFNNINATKILGAFNIIGDYDLKFKLKLENSSFTFREGADYKGETFEGAKLLSSGLFNAKSFGQIKLRKVTLTKPGSAPLMNCYSGNSLVLDQVNFISDNPSEPYLFDKIKNTKLTKLKFSQPEPK